MIQINLFLCHALHHTSAVPFLAVELAFVLVTEPQPILSLALRQTTDNKASS